MKFIAKLAGIILLLYVLCCLALAVYFSQANGHAELLESTLSKVFKRSVTIDEVHTRWNGFSPQIQIKNLTVAGDKEGYPALSFISLAAELDGKSIFKLWPMFNEFAIEQPSIEIVSLNTNQVQIAGIPLKSGKAKGVSPQKLISWLLNHKSLVWHDGEIIWRRLDGEIHRYANTSFIYERVLQNREVRVTTNTTKGQLAFIAKASGEIISSENWNASLEVLGQAGRRLIAPQDLSLNVKDGTGELILKTLNVGRVRDFLRLVGLGGENNWLLRSQLQGRLHDVIFSFSGPLMSLNDWTLKAHASEIEFNSVFPAPAMNKLSGELTANREGGLFKFATSDALFDWPRWFKRPFRISESSGEMHWSIDSRGKVQLRLADVLLRDDVINISKLNAQVELDTSSRNISTVGELFKLESISDLTFEDGQVVESTATGKNGLRPLFLNASLEFAAADMAQITNYLPSDPRLEKLRTWWSNAMLSGEVYAGQVSYQGEVSKNAIYVGKADLTGSAQYKNVEIDYGYQRGWPVLRRGAGSASLMNDLLSFQPKEAWLENDRLIDPVVEIHSLFKLDRRLDLTAKMNTSLAMVTDFLIDGPLIDPSKQRNPIEITVDRGDVSADVSVSIPLRRVRNATVLGTAKISSGSIQIPPSVTVTDVNSIIKFTEKSATAETVSGQFLGHPVDAKLITTKAAKPPHLTLQASGRFAVPQLVPWVGEHMASWFKGGADWQGELNFAGEGLSINAQSELEGVEILAPAPLSKLGQETRAMSVTMELGGPSGLQQLSVSAGEEFNLQFANDPEKKLSLLEKSLIKVGSAAVAKEGPRALAEGVHFVVEHEQVDLDQWLSAIIDLTQLETKDQLPDPIFLDAMRSIKIDSPQLTFMGRNFGEASMSALSANGYGWVGSIGGERMSGTLRADPRANIGKYSLQLQRFYLPENEAQTDSLAPVDSSLLPSEYPIVELQVDDFRVGQKHLGQLLARGEPDQKSWTLKQFSLIDQGITTTAEGQWINNKEQGTISSFNYKTVIDEAGDVLDGMDLAGVLKRGQGTLNGKVEWIGAPHEFEYGRLNGDFDLRIQDGELVKVEPGGGKLLGLLNFNAFARRLTLDFSDIFSTGLSFDRIRFAGVLADGHAVMRDAYVFSPAVFIQMEGKLDLNQESIDMEVYLSPELGGNLTLLSALANPAAGAVVFITQQLFKDEMRESSLRGYRALGTWEEFELEEIGRDGQILNNKTQSKNQVTDEIKEQMQ